MLPEHKSKKCATPGCNNPERWISIAEGNRLGHLAPRRCVECCEKVDETTLAATTGGKFAPIEGEPVGQSGRGLRAVVAMSVIIHPDWTEEDHKSYLVNDEFMELTPQWEAMIGIVLLAFGKR